MVIRISEVNSVEVDDLQDNQEVTIILNEKDGSFYGSKTEIKMPAKSYKMLEEAVVEKWLEKVKDSI